MRSNRIRTILSAIWLLFTISLVSWWFIFVLRGQNPQDLDAAAKQYRMLYLEGSTLILSILLGGSVMIFLSRKDDIRHQRLKHFFSNFTHDIKTSITRLRLQADILTEQNEVKNNRVLQRLLNDISKLDLQLENSLLLTSATETGFLTEKINFKNLVNMAQIEFEDLKITTTGNAEVLADSRALGSIVRNLLENSRRHGQATDIQINIVAETTERVRIHIQDNGIGSLRPVKKLGFEILPSSQNQGTGIGLYLAKQLVGKMTGSISFQSNQDQGFRTELVLRGRLI